MEQSEYNLYALAAGAGLLALSPLPGRNGDYAADLRKLMQWQPAMVVSLTEAHEMEAVKAGDLGSDLDQRKIRWRHWPIADFGVPGPDHSWTPLEAEATAILDQAGRVLVHCKGGCGRSGMVALRLLIATGDTQETALRRLRSARPCAVETSAQLAWAHEPSKP